MHWFVTIIVTVLESYLALTGAIADTIEHALMHPSGTPVITAAETQAPVSPDTLARLTDVASRYESIPQILIDTLPSQAAAAITSRGTTIYSAANISDSVVNLYCTYQDDTKRYGVSGTGFIIGEQGVILTNAHVAQMLILEEVRGTSECVIRTGSPAKALYQAELLYVSVPWILEHATTLASDHPKGTGERDFALLYITNSVDTTPVPARFPALPLQTELLPVGTVGHEVTISGYPAAGAFEKDDLNATLTFETTTTTVTELLTFGSNYADLLSTAGSPLGEQGISGGPIIDTSGGVIGMISTLGDASKFGSGSLRAITLPYVDRALKEESNWSLQEYVSSDLPKQAAAFKSALLPYLQKKLLEAGVQ